jgi:2,4-dienoyl-CoA reductase-like NADH-dependent reductase (Old Yellow Enzyme family)
MTGQLPISASAVPITDSVHRWDGVPAETWETPKAMTQADIDRVKGEYVAAAVAARESGFDGVEVHGANGYLPDQFMHSNINQRTDAYGGSPENRCRFLLELVSDLGQAIGFDRVGVRLAPFGFFNQTRGHGRVKQWTYVCRELAALNVAYVHLIEPRFDEVRSEQDKLRDLTSTSSSAPAGSEDVEDKPPFTEDQLTLKLFRAELGNTPCIVAGGYNPSNCWTGIEEVHHI